MRSTRALAVLSIAGMICIYGNVVPIGAQTVMGTILGTVRDSNGAVLRGVKITARRVETGVVRNATTDDLGVYHIPDVPAGAYEVTTSIAGFKTEVRRDLTVTVGASIIVNFDLAVGQVEEKVDIVGEAPLVETTTSTMSGLVNDVTIRELPLNGRDWLQLAVLQPGATFSPVQFQNDVARLPRGNGLAISISGGRPTENVYRMDGLVINDFANASPGSALWVNLGVDAIREFSVLTDTYSAEYGRSSGGVINAITKSGANGVHGTAFYFTRNSALDARNFFDKKIPPFRRHQFGGSLGGPIRKEKTFFFVNYEGLREFKSLSFVSTTLSPNARAGHLANGQTVTIDPRIKPYLALYPSPNGQITGDTGQFIFGGGRTGNENFVVGKIDHMFSEKTTLNATYRFDGSQVSTPDAYDQKLTSAQARHQDFILSLQHVFSPTLLNTVRAGLTRTWATDGFDISPKTPLLTDPSLGFVPGRNVGEFNVAGLGSTFGGIGDTGADVVGYTAPQVYDDLSWTRGRHSLRMGFGVERLLDNVNPQTTPNGTWAFDNIQNMLTAKPSQFTAAVPGSDTVRGLRTTIFSGYLQDDFRFRPNLNLNLGMRYEMSTSINEVNGKIGNLRSLTDAQPTVGNPLFLNPTLGNLEPRLGLAWDPFKDGKTSVRAGFGIYDVLPLPYLFWNKSTHGLPFFQLAVVSKPPASEFPDKGLASITNQLRVASVEFRPHRPYKMQWNTNIQRQLGKNLSLMVGYVGSSTSHLPVGQNDADQVPLALTTKGPNGQITFPSTGTIQRINTHFSRIDDTLFYGHATYHALQTSLMKRLSHGLSLQGTYTWSKSIDNGSTFFSQNETSNGADPIYVFDPSLNRGVSDFDIRHNAAINAVWQVPSPPSLEGVPRFLLSGWEIGGIFTIQSGSPFTVGLTNDQGRTGTSTRGAAGGQRPNYTPGPACTSLVNNPRDPRNYINTNCFSFPALGTLGNLGRNALRGPTLKDLDFSLFKNGRLWGEKLKVQFRAEAFNILNHPNFSVITTTLFDGTGNLIPSLSRPLAPTATTSRQIQFGMKFIW